MPGSFELERKMKRLTGGQAAVEALRAEEIGHVFGLVGSATMELFDALHDADDIRFFGVRDERTGAHMADGFSRMSGKPGIVLAGQNGPGATNLVTGLAQAKAAYSPVISVAGALSSSHRYRDAFQELDQDDLMRAVTKKSWTVPSCDRIPEMFREAFRHAMAPRRGPVQLNLPRDVLSAQSEFPEFSKPFECRPTSIAAGSQEVISSAASLLATASRPLIIAGGGIKNSGNSEKCVALAESLNCPVATSPGHGDAMPFGHPLNAGQMGPRGNPVATRLAKEADVILALGTRLGFNSTFYSHEYINPDAEIIHVELEPAAIGRHFPARMGIMADASSVADQIRREIERTKDRQMADEWTSAFRRERAEWLKRRDGAAMLDAIPIHPSGLFKKLRDILPKNAAVTLDAGTLCLQATDALEYNMPRSLFTPLDFGLVGFSFACGLGVKVAAPDRPVVSLMGDGGFGMTVSELSTAVDCGINTVTLVLNNGCWGAEKAYQREFFSERYIGADISSPPFDKLAELYGAKGYKAVNIGDMASALEDALECDMPVVIDVQMDPDALYSFRRDSFSHRN